MALEGTNLVEGSFHVVPRYTNLDFTTNDDDTNYQTSANRQYTLQPLVAGADGVTKDIGDERLCPSYAANMTGYYSEPAVVARHTERVNAMFTGTDVMHQCSGNGGTANGANNVTD